MKMKFAVYLFFIAVLILHPDQPIKAQAVLDLEGVVVSTGYNDVRIPGDLRTLFSLKDDLTAEQQIYYRVRLYYTFNSRHTFSVLYASLTTISMGKISYDVNFADVLFPANTKMEATYKFN